MSEYGDIWVSSAQKCRPTADWHWSILCRDLRMEYATLRCVWMMQFMPGKSFLDRKLGWYGNLVAKECLNDWSVPFDIGARIVTHDCERIIAALEKKFKSCGRQHPSRPTLELRMTWKG